jgi:hypothetical protein
MALMTHRALLGDSTKVTHGCGGHIANEGCSIVLMSCYRTSLVDLGNRLGKGSRPLFRH